MKEVDGLKSELLQVKNIVKNYGDNTVLKGVSFTVDNGEIFALLRGNGTGKTTMLSCIEGILKYDSGEISIMGYAPTSKQIRKNIGVQLQSTSLNDNITVLEALKLFSKWNKVKLNLELLNTFGLSSIKNKQYEQLSTGQKRRLHLALALVSNPKLIFLDEPTAGLDVEGRIALHQAIRDLKKEGKTIILASHDMAEVEALCDRIAILKGGTIVFTGTTEEITSIYNNVVNVYVKTLNLISNSYFKYIRLINKESDYNIYSTSNIQEGLFELLENIKSNDNNIIDIKIERPTLEDKFIEISQEVKC